MSVVDGGGVRVLDVAFDHPLVRPLVEEQQEELAVRYGNPDESPLGAADFFPPLGSFFVAVVGGEPVGCAGLRTVPEQDSTGRTPAAEIKRMYTRASVRRQGVAGALLEVVFFRAVAMRCSWVLLETGTKQPDAIAFYEQHGFDRIDGFGHYKDYQDQVSMAFDLKQIAPTRR